MISNRNVLVVWKQGCIGSKQLADIGCVMNTRIEVRVVTNREGQQEPALGARSEQRLDRFPGSLAAQKIRKLKPQRLSRRGSQRKQAVECRTVQRWAQFVIKEPRRAQFPQIEDPLADCNTRPRRIGVLSEDPERQVLYRKLRVSGRARNPANPSRVMGSV